jgi:hypothetical protein
MPRRILAVLVLAVLSGPACAPASADGAAVPSDAPTGPTASAPGSVASESAPPSAAPTVATASPSTPDAVMSRYNDRLHDAGDHGRCDEETNAVSSDLARDTKLSDADLTRELKLRDTTNSGPMPYPSPGTACAIFGIQKALHRAIDERGAARSKP